KWSLDEFLQLPAVKVYADFHCVTRWSRLDNLWGGVSTRTIAELVGVNSEARFVLVEAQDHGWTTNLPVEYFLAEDSLFAWSNDGQAKRDRKSTRLNSSHSQISYAVFCLKKKKKKNKTTKQPRANNAQIH